MKLIRARCCAQKRPSPCSACSVWSKWNIDILSQNAASRTQFFQVQAIKTGHISMIYRQTGDILSVSSKDIAAAKKVTDENFKITLQILQSQTPKFHSNSVSALCEGWLQCIASVMQGLLTLQSHRCKLGHPNSPESEKLKCCYQAAKMVSRF